MLNTLSSKVFKVLVDLRNSTENDNVVIHMDNYIENNKINFFKLRTYPPKLYTKSVDYIVQGDYFSFPRGTDDPNNGRLIHKKNFAVLICSKGDLSFSFLKYCNKEILIKIDEDNNISYVSSVSNTPRY